MKITKMFMTVSAAMILLAGTGLTSASADGGSYDTDGTVSFVVNPDDPSQSVVPDDNSGNGQVQCKMMVARRRTAMYSLVMI